MLFDDFYYFLFLGVIFVTFHLLKGKSKIYLLLLASLFFIGILSFYILLFAIIFSAVNYFLGIIIDNAIDRKKRKLIFRLSIGMDIGLLAVFKYLNFIIENINATISFLTDQISIPYQSLIIPIGISYYTFQAIGYLIRINRGSEKAERNPVDFILFMTFFPKFLAGPVERSNHFLPQIKTGFKFNEYLASAGIRLFLWGLFKKVVIADNLFDPILLVYNNVNHYSGVSLITVMFLQTIHIYCDFSGYTDMALGSAKIFGIDLIDNFRRPFFAKTVGELWRRWHISLSSWCNDFIYMPFIVKYRKMGNRAAIIGIFITFFIIGIWHGANWTYVVLGILQGIAISYEFYTKRYRNKVSKKINPNMVNVASRIFTYTFFSFSLIFFNAHNINDAVYFVSHLFTNIEIKLTGHDLIYHNVQFLVGLSAFLILLLIEYFKETGRDLMEKFILFPPWLKSLAYYFMILMIYYFSGSGDNFVYLQF